MTEEMKNSILIAADNIKAIVLDDSFTDVQKKDLIKTAAGVILNKLKG